MRNLSKASLASELSQLKSSLQSAISAPIRRISCLSRLPSELGSVGSLLPLHSAVASARLISSLSIESQSWGLVPQGISMPLRRWGACSRKECLTKWFSGRC